MNPRSIAAIAMAAMAALTLPAAAAQVEVGVSVQISQPGVYGRIDIGRYPQPQVFVAQPVYAKRPRYVVAQPQVVYMWVPPGHRRNWKAHCRAYGACAAPVVFVRDDWYDSKVRPHGRGDDRNRGPGADRGNSHGNGNGKGRHGRDD